MLTANVSRTLALILASSFLSVTVRAAAPDHPIITEVYNDPIGSNDGPLGHDPANAHQEYIEIYLPTAADLAPGLNKDALNLAFYEVEGDINSSGYTLVNYRIDLPTFDLDPTEIPTAGAVARPPSGIVVIGWLDYTNNDAGTCDDNGAPCSLLAQNCTGVDATCDPDMPTALAGTPSTRVALINGGVTATTDFLFIALNGDQFGGTTNFPVPVAISLINMPNEARSGIIQNGSAAYLLVNRDDVGYVELYDDKDAAHVPQATCLCFPCDPTCTNADPDLADGNVLRVSSLFDGLAANDHADFVLEDQPFRFDDSVDLANVLPEGGPFTPLIPQLAEGLDNGYLRLVADAPKTSEDGFVGNEDPAVDAQNAYRNTSNLGPWFATPGRATFIDSPPELSVAASSLQVLDLVSQTNRRIDLLAANLGGSIAMEVTTAPGASSDPVSVTFSPNGPVLVDTAQTAFNPGFDASVSAAASHDALVTAPVTIEGSTVNAGDPPVINPVWETTATVRVLNPATGQDANGLPFETTVFVAVQGVPQDPAVANEFLATDLGAFLAAQPNIGALDTFGHGPTLISSATNLSDPTTARAMIAELPEAGEECVNWLPRLCCPLPPGFVDTVLNSAEVLSGTLSYDAGTCAASGLSCGVAAQDCADLSECLANPSACDGSGLPCSVAAQDCADESECVADPVESSLGWCVRPGEPRELRVKGIRVNLPDTKTFNGTFSPSELVHFVGPTGGVGNEANGLTNVTTTRTFEVALIDTTLNLNGSLETGAADDFGIVIEVEETELGAPVATGDFVFLSFAGGREGADLDTLDVPPGDSVAVIIYLDLDNLHDVLGIRTIEALFVIDARGGSGVDIMEGFSLNLSTVGGCSVDADCSDGLFCSGVERCIGTVCQPGTPVDCDDGIVCTADSCNDAAGVCDHVPDHASCTDGVFCSGVETCDLALGCVSPGNPCVNPLDCDEGSGTCGANGCLASGLPRAERINSVVSAKNRFLSFEVGDPGQRQAILVTFTAVPPPYDVWNGSQLWVGPPSDVSQSGSSVEPVPGFLNFKAATLQCLGPDYRDWSTFPAVHVFHEGVVPGGLYQIQVIDETCNDLTDPNNFSAPLELMTSGLGDTIGTCASLPCTPPDGSAALADVLAILDRFVGSPNSIVKPRADLEPACLDLKVNISDVLMGLRGFVILPYPFIPTTLDPCDSPCQTLVNSE